MPPEKSFRLLRLRFLRLPPTWIQLSTTNTGGLLPVELELAVGITDDYGVHVGSFEAVELSLQAVDFETRKNIPGISISLGKLSPTSHFTLYPASGEFHTLKVVLTFDRSIQYYPPSMCFQLSIKDQPPDKRSDFDLLEGKEKEMLAFLGETKQIPIEGWDDERYIFMRVVSGNTELRRFTKKISAESGGKNDGVPIASSKVQTTYRTTYIPSLSDSTGSTPSSINVLEQPGLNNSTGQRLWDAAIILSFYLSHHPTALTSLESLETLDRPTKRVKNEAEIHSQSTSKVLELGAGCGLVGITAASVLFKRENLINSKVTSKVTLTDIEATVGTTLLQNRSLNATLPFARLIDSTVLDWGPLTPSQITSLLPSNLSSLTILGSDILYNPSSHQVLLETIRDLFGAVKKVKALVAYKPRTEGDGDFFQMAKQAGFNVECKWRWGEVTVWEIGRK